MKLRHFFLPHPETHQKAHLISTGALAVYLAFFMVLHIAFGFMGVATPEVLGVSSNVSTTDLINLTNVERQKLGLEPLSEDPRLDAAALAKAQNMFAENYWAHYSPSGKDPWGFILGSGYKFTYAGENLARNFYNSPEVVGAWMASPTHRDNIVNSHYKNVGMAVLEGTLNGQPTLLVVQEFGSPYEAVAQTQPTKSTQVASASIASTQPTASPISSLTPVPTTQPLAQASTQPVLNAATQNSNLNNQTKFLGFSSKIDPYLFTKNLGNSLLLLIAGLTLVDLYLLRRRAVVRLASRHLPHFVFLIAASLIVFNLSRGTIT